MKTRVGELYNKPIVIGNPNEFTKDEIALKDLQSKEREMLYFDIISVPEEERKEYMAYAEQVKIGNAIYRCGYAYMAILDNPDIGKNIVAISIDPSGFVYQTIDSNVKIADMLQYLENLLPKITKEEFYNLN